MKQPLAINNEHLTLIAKYFDRLQDPLGVYSRLVVVHLCVDNIANPGRSAPDGARSAVKSVGVTLLQSQHALVHVLQNVVLGHGEEIVYGGDVVNRLSQNAHLVLPGLTEHFHVFLCDLRARSGSQDLSCVNYLVRIIEN